MKNWRTTLFGAIGALGAASTAYVLANPGTFSKWPWAVPVAGIVTASGILGQGIVGKDAATHSTVEEVNQASVVDVEKGAPLQPPPPLKPAA